MPGLPIDLRLVPQSEPLRASPIAQAAPAIDIQSAESERVAAAAAAAELQQSAVGAMKRRSSSCLLERPWRSGDVLPARAVPTSGQESAETAPEAKRMTLIERDRS